MSALVETMMYVEEGGVPWHGLGTSVKDAPGSREAALAAGIAWEAEKRPLFVNVAGEMVQLNDRFAVVRKTDEKVLGVVTSDYVLLQNTEAFEILDTVIGELGLDVTYETAGALRGGREVFMTARIPRELKIGSGDVQFPWLMLRTGHDGGTGLDILPTFIRPVCWNTVTGAMLSREHHGKEYFGLSMWHTGNVADKVAQARSALNLSLRQIDDYELVMNQLCDVAVSPAMLEEFTSAVVPEIWIAEGSARIPQAVLPMPDSQRWVQFVSADQFDRAVNGREERVEAFLSCYSEEPKNAYGLFNAATGYADHARPRMWKAAENRLNTVMWGNGATIKRRAYKAIATLAAIEPADKVPE